MATLLKIIDLINLKMTFPLYTLALRVHLFFYFNPFLFYKQSIYVRVIFFFIQYFPKELIGDEEVEGNKAQILVLSLVKGDCSREPVTEPCLKWKYPGYFFFQSLPGTASVFRFFLISLLKEAHERESQKINLPHSPARLQLHPSCVF